MSYPARVPPYMTAGPPKRHENAVTLECDCCGGRASIVAVTHSGPLAFCGHHAYVHFPALTAAGHKIIHL